MKKTPFVAMAFLFLLTLHADWDTRYYTPKIDTAFTEQKANLWADSLFNTMSEDQRLGQLFIIRAHSDKGSEHITHVENLIKQYHIGGLCFFQGTPEKQAELTNRFQQISQIPLLMTIDAEWGLGMRFKESCLSFPRQLTLGAIQDNRLIYEMGKEIARECRRIGVHLNYAPVADVNNNIKNPVINTRSFGEDRTNVAAKCFMYMKGMQDNGVMACIKHFPGHGDTDVDSHRDLPVIPHRRPRLDSLELYPFKVLAQHGVQSIMVAHLNVPVLDSTKNTPTSLSYKTITKLLREDIGYNGLIFTDGLEMKGVTKYYREGEAEVKALQAGNDVLCLPENTPAAFAKIKEALRTRRLAPQQIDESVRKMLRAKYRLGLNKKINIEPTNLLKEINTAEAKALKRKLVENALTLVRDEDGIFPIKTLQNVNFATLCFGSQTRTPFQKRLSSYTSRIEHFNVGKTLTPNEELVLLNKLKNKNLVFVCLNDMNQYANKDFGLTDDMKGFVQKVQMQNKTALVVFGNPYSLKYYDRLKNVIVAYDDDYDAQDLTAQAIFGAFSFKGKLPVTASPRSPFGEGIMTANLKRLGYDLPERVGLNSDILNEKIDSIATAVIDGGATPGLQVLVAKDGRIVFHKPYGFHTYQKQEPVTADDVYDLASVTKICATTLSVMKLQEEGKVNLSKPMSSYVPWLRKSNKENLTVEDIMIHHAGLISWIKFYESTLVQVKNGTFPSPEFYKKEPDAQFFTKVAENFYIKNGYDSLMKKQIAQSDLRNTQSYKYSDLGFYMLTDLIRNQAGKSIKDFAQENFYEPLGLQTTGYLPLERSIPHYLIVPTEEDNYFRHQRIQGYVHDMGAAMWGGVSGHAGLFSNATDLAVLLEMLLNNGEYGGISYFKPETVQKFTTRSPKSTRRGIGFDMKELDAAKIQNTSALCAANTFGHQGFTGTCVWADPDNHLIYIFLSNRTYPTLNNVKLNKENVRERIQTAIYQSFMELNREVL